MQLLFASFVQWAVVKMLFKSAYLPFADLSLPKQRKVKSLQISYPWDPSIQ